MKIQDLDFFTNAYNIDKSDFKRAFIVAYNHWSNVATVLNSIPIDFVQRDRIKADTETSRIFSPTARGLFNL